LFLPEGCLYGDRPLYALLEPKRSSNKIKLNSKAMLKIASILNSTKKLTGKRE
jgi:hypothetical protein